MAEHNITVLGSTGSVGTQALDVARRNNYRVEAISAGSNIDLLEQQIREFKPSACAVESIEKADELKKRIHDLDTKVFAGTDGICEMASFTKSELVLNSVIGLAGLRPTLAVIEAKKTLALANKESMVVAGDLINEALKRNNVKILPVDSEHSAIFQCLEGNRNCNIRKILLTASGGPFYGMKFEQLEKITVEQALAHPTWKMGKKITIDSSTLLNKGFEIIEAVHLFGVPEDKIEVIIHRESIIHSMVEYDDNTVLAQMSVPDMRNCIQYAITYPERTAPVTERLDLCKLGSLTFAEPDTKTFPLLNTAREAIRTGGTAPAALNAANEVAVEKYLNGKIAYTDIFSIVNSVVKCIEVLPCNSLKSVLETDRKAREMAEKMI